MTTTIDITEVTTTQNNTTNDNLNQNKDSISNKSTGSNLYTCYLGLGSNLTNELGSPEQHILTAVDKLKNHQQIQNVRCSSLYVSEPYGVTDQPDFTNAVVHIDTCLTPQQLLELCHKLEHAARRKRLRHWGERTLDVDILLYADQQVNTDTLTIPHPEICKRNFVLIPLVELNNHLNILDKPITTIAMSQDWSGIRLMI